MNRFSLIRAIGDRNKGHFEKHKSFRHRKCRSLKLRSEIPVRVQMDGESFYAHEVRLEIVPNGIKFVAPEGRRPVDYSHLAYRQTVRKGMSK
jgi:diacylglycerol kinase family enzyme